MNREKLLKSVLTSIVTISCLLIISFIASANYSPSLNSISPDALAIESLNIISDQAILQGDTQQMRVEEFDEFTLFNKVEWTSSDPNIISCT